MCASPGKTDALRLALIRYIAQLQAQEIGFETLTNGQRVWTSESYEWSAIEDLRRLLEETT